MKQIVGSISRIIEEENVTSLYQPILSLHNGEIIGYEALSRGPVNSDLYSPLRLIEMAEEEGLTWDLEMLFRKKAIEKATCMPMNKLLFLNVDPNIIKDNNYKKGFTKNYLQKHNIDPKNIVFEITERTAIEDYETFKTITDHYKEESYHLAIDDVGSGYSGLRTITELHPNYVKIDMDLIRDIDTDTFKQSLIKALVTMAKETKITLIGEGVESIGELRMLIKLGVHLAQGYLLQRPNENVVAHLPEVRDMILQLSKEILDSFSFEYAYNCVGKIAKRIQSYSPDIKCQDIKTLFDNSDVDSLCIANDDGYPEGMIMKHYLNSKLADRYGYDLYSGRNIKLLMDVRPLTIDFYTPVTSALSLAMQRSKDKLYDDVVVTHCSKYYGMTTIYDIISHTMEYEKRYAKQLNPLTSLPGNIIIRQVLEQYINNGELIGLLYIDLDHFKAYNDVYGFENGDAILQRTANIIEEVITGYCDYNFVGHIGGDDFIAIVKENHSNVLDTCNQLISQFDLTIVDFFEKEDIELGHYTSLDRHNNARSFPITSISIAGYYGSLTPYSTPEDLGNFMGVIKKQVKAIEGSAFKVVDYN